MIRTDLQPHTMKTSSKASLTILGTLVVTLALVILPIGRLSAQVDYASQIQPIFNASCTSCHGGTSDVYLNSYTATMASVGDKYDKKIVSPGDPAGSPLYEKLLPNPSKGARMPIGGQLTQAQIDLIRTWIAEGASEVPTSLQRNDGPLAFRLEQNYPNPFNPTTQIRYSLPSAQHVRVELWSITGSRLGVLVDDVMPAGMNTLTFNALSINLSTGGLTSGTYLYRIVAQGFTETRAMTLVR